MNYVEIRRCFLACPTQKAGLNPQYPEYCVVLRQIHADHIDDDPDLVDDAYLDVDHNGIQDGLIYNLGLGHSYLEP